MSNNQSDKQQQLIANQDLLHLTPTEAQWVQSRSTLKVAYHPNDFPYQFTDNSGLLGGISSDVLRILAQKLNRPLGTNGVGHLLFVAVRQRAPFHVRIHSWSRRCLRNPDSRLPGHLYHDGAERNEFRQWRRCFPRHQAPAALLERIGYA